MKVPNPKYLCFLNSKRNVPQTEKCKYLLLSISKHKSVCADDAVVSNHEKILHLFVPNGPL